MIKTKLVIGKVLKPRGLKGEIKLEVYSSNPNRLKKIPMVTIENKEYAVEKINLEGIFAYLKLVDINSIDEAESLRNKIIYAKKEDLPKLPEDAYYIEEVKGCKVYVEDKLIGEVKDILQYGSADVYVVKTNKGEVSFPALKKVLIDVDVSKGIIHLDKKAFVETAVFNE